MNRIWIEGMVAAGMGLMIGCVGPDGSQFTGGSGGNGTGGSLSDGGGTPEPTFEGSPICASGSYAPEFSGEGNSDMTPGQACIQCHKQQGGPTFTFGGTVFAAGKVTDLCLPPATVDLTQATVIIIDANHVEHPLSVNYVGNFRSSKSTSSWLMPYTAKVTYQGKERVMVGAQQDGDCNKCHTAEGANQAPGRIALP